MYHNNVTHFLLSFLPFPGGRGKKRKYNNIVVHKVKDWESPLELLISYNFITI